MPTKWSQARIERLIKAESEESLYLDYKAADALAKSDGKKKEISKDVSALANSAGGTLIYGVKEYQDAAKAHIPETLDPIDATVFTKEWLEQVINSNIQPRIDGLAIHPVRLKSGSSHAAYVIEVPQSNTAHMAKDNRYYKRFNFESVAMEDYEVRQTMNRATVPDVNVDLIYRADGGGGDTRFYNLEIWVENKGALVVRDWGLSFSFPRLIGGTANRPPIGKIQQHSDKDLEIVNYWSDRALFPNQRFDLNKEIGWHYTIRHDTYPPIRKAIEQGQELLVTWNLYADNMPPKHGSKPFTEFWDYEDYIAALKASSLERQ